MLDIDIRLRRGIFTLSNKMTLTERVVGLFGPSGSGKSTLLAAIAGLHKPETGHVVLNARTLFNSEAGIDVPAHQRQVGLMLQSAHLFPHLNVQSNMRYGMRLRHTNDRRLSFDHIVQLLELDTLLNRAVQTLSGGEQQRVALGRALLAAPSLLLLDEPLAALDYRLKQQVLPFLRRVIEELDISMVYVSHAINEILYLTSTLAVLEKGELIAYGRFVDVVHNERVLGLAHSLGLENVLKLTIVEHDGVLGYSIGFYAERSVYLPVSDIPPGQAAHVSVRAENIALALHPIADTTIQNQLPGTITRVTRIENRMLVEIDIGTLVIAEVSAKGVTDLGLIVGTAVICLIKSNAIHYLGYSQ